MESKAVVMDRAIKAMAVREDKYLTFTLAGEEYGIGLLKVREIMDMKPVARAPRSPGFIRGVIKLRGKIVPIVDLGRRLGGGGTNNTDKACIIVVEVAGALGQIQMGMAVDSISEVLNLPDEKIAKAHPPEASRKSQNILGAPKVKGAPNGLLDIDRLLSEADAASLEHVLLAASDWQATAI